MAGGRRSMRGRHRRDVVLAVTAIGLLAGLSVTGRSGRPATSTATAGWDSTRTDLRSGCSSPWPPLVVARQRPAGVTSGDRVAVLAFDGRCSDPVALASDDQVGAGHSLAVDHGRGAVFSAAYHKRATAFGPGGPESIYRIDLDGGEVRPWAVLPAGPDRHTPGDDAAGAPWVGRTSLGDIKYDAELDLLLVSNLYDGRIYRLSTADGTIAGSIAHGGSGATCARRARLFGLGLRDGWLWHGVVDTGGLGSNTGSPMGHLCRSRTDGSGMSEVMAFEIPTALGWAT